MYILVLSGVCTCVAHRRGEKKRCFNRKEKKLFKISLDMSHFILFKTVVKRANLSFQKKNEEKKFRAECVISSLCLNFNEHLLFKH